MTEHADSLSAIMQTCGRLHQVTSMLLLRASDEPTNYLYKFDCFGVLESCVQV